MTTAATPARSDGPGARERTWVLVLVVCAIYAALLLATKPSEYSDTLNYGKHIAFQHSNPPEPASNPFFEFGHPLWKLVGYACWLPLRGRLNAVFGGDDISSAAAALIALSMVAGAIGAIFQFLLIRRSIGRSYIAVGVTTAYLGTNALLHWTQTGMAYVPGIACQVVALYLIRRAVDGGRFTFRTGFAAGAVLGLSFLFWFPYILAGAGVLAFAFLCDGPDAATGWRGRRSGAAGLVAGAAAITLGVYACVVAATHPTSVQQVTDWINRSRYGKKPDRGLIRLLGGVPRGFVDLSTANTAVKRILFERSAASLVELARTGLWKIPMVYLALGAAVVALWRTAWGRRDLWCLAAIGAPLVYFAAFLFEATPPERYLAAFPLLYLSFGRIQADRRSPRWVRIAIACFFAISLLVNIAAMRRGQGDPFPPAAVARAQSVAAHVNSADTVFVSSFREDVMLVLSARPFSPVAAKTRYSYEVALPWGLDSSYDWRRQFARRVLAVWRTGGQVWVSRRLIDSEPDPSIWVEGDIPGLSWQQAAAFFRRIELGTSFGGLDGFAAVARTPNNEQLLSRIAGTTNPAMGR